MRILVNIAFLIGFLGIAGGFGYWVNTRFVANDDFIAAAARGDLDGVRKGLANHAGINATNMEGNNALGLAVKGGHFEIVKVLVDAGADVNKRTLDTSPLAWSLVHNHMEIFQLLRARGALLDCTKLEYDQLVQQAKNRGGGPMLDLLQKQYEKEGGARQ